MTRKNQKGVEIVSTRGPARENGRNSVVRLNVVPSSISFKSEYELVTTHDSLVLANYKVISETDVSVFGTDEAIRRVVEYGTSGSERSRSTGVFTRTKGEEGYFVTLFTNTPANKPEVNAEIVAKSLEIR